MARRFPTWLLAGVLLVASGCSDDGPQVFARTASLRQPIVNGQLDTTHQAVVAVFTNNSKCSGTFIEVDQPNGFVLTAAHCVDEPPQVVVQGNDHDSPTATYNVQDYAAHPGYNGSVNDFAMIRVTGASTAGTPVIAAMASGEDNIVNGTAVTHVGYGLVGATPDVDTTLRHYTTGNVSAHTALTLTFDASTSGVCFGDSGGPNLTSGPTRVAGVNHAVSTDDCDGSSYSGRVSAVYDTFITPFITNAPPPPVDCNGCFEAATTGTGACMSAVNACFDDTDCVALMDCYDGCSMPSCYTQCQTDHPSGLALYTAIFDCVCDSACMTECANANMCDETAPPTTAAVAQASVDASAAMAASGAGGGSGAGGAGSTGNGWHAGDLKNHSTEGTVSTCSAAAPGSARTSWLALALAGIALGCSRRRRAA